MLLEPFILAKNQPRADMRPEEFRKFIVNHGLTCTWEQAAQCPCRQMTASMAKGFGTVPSLAKGTGGSRRDCPKCAGKGWFYHDSTKTVALFMMGSANPAIAAMGEAGRGMASITCLPENLPAYKDRFTLQDSVVIMREGRLRSNEIIEALRFPVAMRAMDTADGELEVGVLYAHKSDDDGLAQLDGELRADVDFVITDDGRIDWTLGDGNGQAPTEGQWYTLTYYHHPRFVVDSIPHGWRDTRITYKHPESILAPMPVQCMGKLEFMGEGGTDG